MPKITATATPTVPNAGDPAPEIRWRAQVTHTAPSGCADTKVDSPEVGTQWSAAVDKRTFSPNFGGVYGGNFILEASCRHPNRRNPAYAGASVSFDRVIRGIQPADSLLKSAINAVAASQLVIGGDRYKRMVVNGAPGAGGGRPEQVSTILKKIACHESFASQFYAGEGVAATPRIGGPRIAGMPVYGGGGDVGIMQICDGRKPRHVWNWVENVKRGAFLLRDPVENLAYNYLLDQVRVALDFNDIDDKDLTDKQRDQIRVEIRKQMKEEAIHRYNAGGVGEYWKWNAGTKMWKPVDRVGRGGKTETLGYVSKVVGVASCSLL